MTIPASRDFSIQRNEDFGPQLVTLTDTEGNVLPLHGWGFTLNVAALPGDAVTLLALSGLPTVAGSYAIAGGADNSQIEIYISRSDLAALPGPDDDFTVLSYNLLGTDPFGVDTCLARGEFVAEPGV